MRRQQQQERRHDGHTSAGSGAAITAPASIASAGKLVFCSDITYPPEESYKAGTTTPEGSDIDIGNYIADKMGVKARFDNTGFDGIIAALLAKKCDAVISGMNDTPERRKQVAFVDYLKVGQSFMVKKGNPENITGIDSLAGQVGFGRDRDDEQGLPRRAEQAAEGGGQAGDQGRHVPEGQRRGERPAHRQGRRVLR